MSKLQQDKDQFVGGASGAIQKAVDSSMSVEPRMLPAQFRRRSHWVQRLFMITVVMLYSVAVGLIITTTMGGLDAAFQITSTSDANGSASYLLMSLMTLTLLLLVSGAFVFWNRTRAYLISKSGFAIYSIPPLVIIIGMIYISRQTGTPYELFKLLGYVGMAMGVLLGGTMSIRAFYHRHWFRDSLQRTIYTVPGLLMASLAPYAMWFMLEDTPTYVVTFLPLVATMGAAVLGSMMLIMGMAFSARYAPVGTKTLWKSIRFSGGLPTITIYTTLVAVAIKFAIGAEITTPLMMSIVINLTLLSVFMIFLFMRGRIKKINVTNPIFNQIIFKSFVAITALVGLLLTEALPSLNPQAKSFGPESYALLAISTSSIIFGTVSAHLLNLITFSKFFKTTISGMLFAVMLILLSVFTIATLRHAGIIFAILSRQLVILFLSIATIIELLLVLGDSMYLVIDVMNIKKSSKQKEENLADIEAEIQSEEEALKRASASSKGGK